MKAGLAVLFVPAVGVLLSGCITMAGLPTPTPTTAAAKKSAAVSPPTATPTPAATRTATATALPVQPTVTPTHEPTAVPTTPPLPAKAPASAGNGSIGEIDRGNTSRPQVALTFDAGASSQPTPRILAALRAHKLHLTFFITGDWAQKNPDLLRQIIADGHELGNHSYTHPDFVNLSDQQMQDELHRTEDTIQRITGHSTKPFFRPPFGSRNSRVIRVVGDAGYRTIYWTFDSGDWVEGAIPSNVLQKVVGGVSNGSIVVNHMGSEATAEILDEIIKGVQNKGFSIVSLSQLIAP